KANGMEENKWGGEWEQPWGSDVNAQANTTTNHTDFLHENTWEESQPVSATTDKVELIETEESESSGHSSDKNPDCNKSETNDSDKEENHVKQDSSVSTTVAEPQISTDVPSWVLNLIDEVKSLKGSQLKQIVKINMLEKRLVESKQEVKQLKNRICTLEHGSQPVVDPVEVDDHVSIKSQSNFDESVYIVGGFDGSSWSSSLESYCPFKDTKSSLNSMQFVKKYASAAILNGELYHFGGEGFHTVESFIPSQNQWVPRPPLFWKNIHVAGASVKDRLFVVGGANGRQCSSEVEYLDLDIGKWIPTCPMLSKRLDPALAELNNALYVSGGYDGASYISSFERHDPREEAWEKLPSMKTKKGCHSMVILNEKLYTLGRFDGNFGAFVLDEKLYTIGGVKENEVVMDIVECFKEGSCWEIVDLKAIGKRSHFSAIVA
ncbi:putative development/cell death domain, kelch-type beta propeller containing protein, partial [Tanacetum coccineum]